MIFKLNYLHFKFNIKKQLVPLTESYCLNSKKDIVEVKSTLEAFGIGGLNNDN